MATPNVLETRAGSGLGARTQIITMATADQAAMDAQIAELGPNTHYPWCRRYSRRNSSDCSTRYSRRSSNSKLVVQVAVTVAHDFAE